MFLITKKNRLYVYMIFTSNSIENKRQSCRVAVLHRWFRSDRLLSSSSLQYLSFSLFRVIARRYTEFRIRPGENLWQRVCARTASSCPWILSRERERKKEQLCTRRVFRQSKDL